MPFIELYHDPLSSEKLNEVLLYIDSAVGKSFREGLIRQQILKVSWKEKDIKLRAKCHLCSFKNYLNDIKASHTSGEINDIIFSRNLQSSLAEIIPYIEQFNWHSDLKFEITYSNVIPSTIHHKFISNLFYYNSLHSEQKERSEIDLFVVYGIRLSIEQRLLGILGIDFIQNGGQPIPITNLIRIFKSLTTIQFRTQINFEHLSLLFKWLNHHIHRHFRPHPWVIHEAFKIINPLFETLPLKTLNGLSKSIYSSTLVVDEKSYKNEVREKIETLYPKAKIYWALNGEYHVPKHH